MYLVCVATALVKLHVFGMCGNCTSKMSHVYGDGPPHSTLSLLPNSLIGYGTIVSDKNTTVVVDGHKMEFITSL